MSDGQRSTSVLSLPRPTPPFFISLSLVPMPLQQGLTHVSPNHHPNLIWLVEKNRCSVKINRSEMSHFATLAIKPPATSLTTDIYWRKFATGTGWTNLSEAASGRPTIFLPWKTSYVAPIWCYSLLLQEAGSIPCAATKGEATPSTTTLPKWW